MECFLCFQYSFIFIFVQHFMRCYYYTKLLFLGSFSFVPYIGRLLIWMTTIISVFQMLDSDLSFGFRLWFLFLFSVVVLLWSVCDRIDQIDKDTFSWSDSGLWVGMKSHLSYCIHWGSHQCFRACPLCRDPLSQGTDGLF